MCFSTILAMSGERKWLQNPLKGVSEPKGIDKENPERQTPGVLCATNGNSLLFVDKQDLSSLLPPHALPETP